MTLTLFNELVDAARDAPDQVFLRTIGEDVTYADMLERVHCRARQLTTEGVKPGSAVALLMRNSVEQVVTWFGLNALGALHAPLNSALRGPMLTHALHTAKAMAIIVDEEHVKAAEQVVRAEGGGQPAHGIPPGIPDLPHLTCRVIRISDLAEAPEADVALPHEVDELDTATLLFTSGTTGPSKACALSHRYLVRSGQLHATAMGITSADVLYCPFPLFHIDAATLTVSAALAARATAALGEGFSASRFWNEIRSTGATVFNFMGATLTLLWKREPTEQDRDHAVRLAWGVPMPEWQPEFETRFGFPVRQVYGLTDGGVPVYDPVGEGHRPGTAGRVLPEYDVAIDPSLRRVGDPEDVGEILIRGREPGLIMNEYFGNPGATAETIVDGWLRTGDLGSLDEDGYLVFHGRLSDSIRRRGENISAFEVEELALNHPDVVEAAALGVPSELTEEDLKVCVVMRAGSGVTPQGLHAYLCDRAPKYMVPRYIEFVDELPKTATQKVEKFRLRADGVTGGTWDADAH